MAQTGTWEIARLLLLLGGAIALIGGVVAVGEGFIDAGSALALIVGLGALLFYGNMASQGVVVVLLLLGLLLAVMTGGLPSVGGIMVSVAALMALVVRNEKT